jgi:hypothetical protein
MPGGCLIVHGHRGAGKTLFAIDLVRQYLERGCPIASNMTINLDHLMGARSKVTYTKLPGIPKAQHFIDLGAAYQGDYDESKHGLCLIDECGTFLNAREWNDPDRKAAFSWITQSRKVGWDLVMMIQDFESLDAQMRRSLADEVVSSMCLNRIKIPFLPIRGPRLHMYVGHYKGQSGAVTFKKYIRGTDLYKAYDTKQLVKVDEVITPDGEIIDMRGPSSGLSAWHLVGRYLPPPPSAFMFVGFLVKWLLAWPTLMVPGGRSPSGTKRAGQFERDLSLLFPLLMPHIAREVADDQRARLEVVQRTKLTRRSGLVADSLEEYNRMRFVSG